MQRAAKRPVHAYLLAGPKDADLVRAARCFATVLVDPEPDARTIELVLKGAHPDVPEFEPELTVMSIDQAREEIIPEAWRAPVEPRSARKVLLVFEPERLSDPAQGALLKTFEEPPASTVIVLVSSAPDELLDTTQSRCQRIDLAPIGEAAIQGILEDEGHDHAAAALASRLAGGQLGRARALLGERRALRDAFLDVAYRCDGTGAAVARLAEELVQAVQDAITTTKAGHEEELAGFDEASERAGYLPRDVARQRRRMTTRHARHERVARREALVEGITALEAAYRDALAGPGAALRNLDRPPPTVEARGAVRALEACRDARRAIQRNPNEGLLIERLLFHLPALAATG
jgi:DNA polymerase-3 subunit delta'